MNNNQNSHGRASIYVGSSGVGDQINAGETSRLLTVNIHGNVVHGSEALGFFGWMVDGLTLQKNKFMNCAGASKVLSGSVVEVGSVTRSNINENTVLDTRQKVKHSHAYSFNNVSGKEGIWYINSTVSSSAVRTGTQPLRIIASLKKKQKE